MELDGGLAWLRWLASLACFFVLAVGKNGLTPAKTTKFPSVGINGRLLQSADGSEQACNFYGG